MTSLLVGAIAQVQSVLASLGDCISGDRLVSARQMLDSTGLEVVVFGAFNRGKSTLINALLGENILPAKLVPTTGHVTRICHGVSREVRVLLRDGTHEACPLDKLDQFSLFADKHVRDDIESIVVNCPCAILKRGLAIVDTPGIQDSDVQTRRAERAVAHAHLILFVLDAQQPLANWEQAQAQQFVENLGKPLVLIINKMNLIDPSERAEVNRRIDRWARRHLPTVLTDLGRSYLEVNALGGLRNALRIGPAPTDDFPSLRSLFSEMNPVQVEELRCRGNLGYLRSEVARMRIANDQLLWQLQNAAVGVAHRRKEQIEMLTGLARKFKSMSAAVEESVILFAQHRLLQLEQGAWPHDNGAPKGMPSCASFEGVLAAVEAEASQRATEFERGILANPAPFTVAEELELRLRSEYPGAAGQLHPLTVAARDPAVASRLRNNAVDLLRSQFRTRMILAQQDMERELRMQQALTSAESGELRLRQALEKALRRLESEIKVVRRTAQVARRAYDLFRGGVGKSVDDNWALAMRELGGERESATDVRENQEEFD